MHLHGHHKLVFARDGRPVTPWWSDTLEVDSGERYDVAVFAKNPGIWMFHCHNLPHAAHGLETHVAYEGVTTPFRMGKSSGNEPE
jgi:FtsP/CotA-like multicopper oxidase with cupredoxin domain